MAAVPRRILVVDDEPDVRISLQELLASLPDCEVEVAEGFAEGRAKAAAGRWDVVYCDERMPDGRGVDILAELARTRPEVVRVLMSAFQDFDMMMRGVTAAHIDHFVQKPWDPVALLQHATRALEGRDSLLRQQPRTGPFRRIGSGPAGPAAAPSSRSASPR